MTVEGPGRRDAPACAPSLFSAEAPEQLALDLTSEAVRLVARDLRGVWTELGAVPLAADDFRAALDALRRQAEALGDLPVALWLPSDQILVRRYVLKRGDRPAEALRRLAEDTGNRAEELTVTLSPAADGELVTVLGASKRTVAEALAYARRWGFRPDRVSTRVEAERFGAVGPAFGLPDPAPRRAGLGAPRALAAAAATLAVGLACWGAYGLLPASEPATLAVAPAPEARASLPGRGTPSDAPAARAHREPGREPEGEPEREPEREEVAPSGVTRAVAAPPPDAGLAHAAEVPAGDAAAPPPEPAAGAPDAPARLGRASGSPERRQPADRTQPAAPEAGANLGTLLAGIDRILADAGSDPARQETAPEDGVVLAASDAAPVTVPGRPMPRPGDPDPPRPGDPDPSGRPADDPHEAEDQPEGRDDLGEAEGSDVPPRPAAMSDSPLAAVLAPPPPARPDRQWQRAPAPGAVRLAAPRIGNAAAQGGLALDATSLIGVIDANSGREALLRTPSGDVLKVTRGDEVAGWRVSAIGHDAMRLTRGVESRTLLLVTR